jgi:hypothetical protein
MHVIEYVCMNGGMAPCILNLNTRWSRLPARPPYRQVKCSRYPLNRRLDNIAWPKMGMFCIFLWTISFLTTLPVGSWNVCYFLLFVIAISAVSFHSCIWPRPDRRMWHKLKRNFSHNIVRNSVFVRSEAFTSAEFIEIFSGYQPYQLVKF